MYNGGQLGIVEAKFKLTSAVNFIVVVNMILAGPACV